MYRMSVGDSGDPDRDLCDPGGPGNLDRDRGEPR